MDKEKYNRVGIVRVGILTFHFSDNYGALFQAYALKRWFDQRGDEAYFIEYHPEYVEAGGNIGLNDLFSKAALKVIFLKVAKVYQKLISPDGFSDSMDDFRLKYLGINDNAAKGIGDALKDTRLRDTDMIVCGSDQIWNPSAHYGVDSVYFLDFLQGSKVRRIAYAPSFGSNVLDDQHSESVGDLISKLDAVSIREESGAAIIEKIANIQVPVVPDPTLLPVDFTPILEKYPENYGNYCFCYYLRSSVGVKETANYLKTTEKMRIICPNNPHRRWKEVGETVYPSPGQWLGLLKDSSIVVTNSFHGVALSIVNQKKFVYVALRGNKKKMNARAFNLLKMTGLEERIVNEFCDIEKVLSTPIDWKKSEKLIVDMQKKGVNFLEEQVKMVEAGYE
ncbi:MULTISPECIES: polysaccharide pyruvyl transferase family protein [unclassified Oceanobacter]|uniref:polysaccharide pyruvyl transferase family protein n=1 Tax=unclassified Oceanobacter TaxID=2620260 RepID=UPI00273528C2|nr:MULTISPECIES: polysaccharide pyruvyl transferase family protein [unclassified Oceanobacter]MDP2548523.1 polysaccharide pyruvyl transferase family protein [Oceanobacter sp. 4_MG-2023]MDP2608082.1 polysaccharide pyruvyl transferase family protein [Oceanobacter sp. 1_MG-2023]MDP2611256.1 polysaccharide pyruvyl transferase family protein [Oceanobacter sp. 2_MG-2023]